MAVPFLYCEFHSFSQKLSSIPPFLGRLHSLEDHMPTDAIISVRALSKIYKTGFQALKNINLDIRRGEIFALLGPNGAGKTTLINTICGIVTPTDGKIFVDGHDVIRDFRVTRSL